MESKKMTKKEENDYLKEMFNTNISLMVGLNVTKWNNQSKKIYKDMLSHGVALALYTINFSSRQYYSWEVSFNEYTPEKNLGRLLYLFNENLEWCKHNIEISKDTEYIIEKDYNISMVNGSEDIKSYEDIAEEVGL